MRAPATRRGGRGGLAADPGRARRPQAAENARVGLALGGLLGLLLGGLLGHEIRSRRRISRTRASAGYSQWAKRATPALTSKNIAPRLTPLGSCSSALLRVQERRFRTVYASEPCRPSRASPRTGLECL